MPKQHHVQPAFEGGIHATIGLGEPGRFLKPQPTSQRPALRTGSPSGSALPAPRPTDREPLARGYRLYHPPIDPPLGILSDSHGDAAITRAAIALLRDQGAGVFVHCGDVGGQGVLDELAGTGCRFVWGNTDVDREGLERYAADLGLLCLGEGGIFVWAGRRIGVAHGDRPNVLRRLLDEHPTIDILLTGHSHVPHDRQVDGIRWINPGALYRAATKTVALLEPSPAPGDEQIHRLVVSSSPRHT